MRLVIVGTGYVGLVTGACLADFGHEVTCVDDDQGKIDILRMGRIPIFEPGLAELVATNREAGRLTFSSDLRSSVRSADAIFIAVGTPPRPDDGHADLSFVFSAARQMAPDLAPGAVVIVKSTVPVGTSEQVEALLCRLRPGAGIAVVSNPEFLRAGSAIRDFKKPDRIVIGADSEAAGETVSAIYRPLFVNAAPLIRTTRRSSELIKYGANALLAAKVAFINEMADLCECVGADVQEVARGIGLDNRIGPKFLDAGPGFGGSCFRKDALALARMGREHAVPLRIIESVLTANEDRRRTVVSKVTAAVGGPLQNKTIAVLGLTFKANTDDVREAPAIHLVAALSRAGACIRVYDPAGMDSARALLPSRIAYARNAYDAACKADALVVMTEWEEFRGLDPHRIRRLMASPVVIDMRNIFSKAEMERAGFIYHRIGSSSQTGTRHHPGTNGRTSRSERIQEPAQQAATMLDSVAGP